jgi:hypothetical protein
MRAGWWGSGHLERRELSSRAELSCRAKRGIFSAGSELRPDGRRVASKIPRSLRSLGMTAMSLLALSGCGRSPADKAEEARTKLRSWDSTMALLGRERATGAVSEQFAEQVRRAADEERRKAEAQLRKAGGQ